MSFEFTMVEQLKLMKKKMYPNLEEMLDHLSNFIRKLLWPYSSIAD